MKALAPIKTLAIAALAAFAAGAGAPPALAEAGSIACQNDLRQVRQDFEAKRDQLTPEEARDIEQRLELTETYCRSNNYSSAVTLSGLDQLRDQVRGIPETQTAEVPYE